MKVSKIALASLGIPSALSFPTIFSPEVCVCEPSQPNLNPLSPPASCSKTAEAISRWRAVSFHRPELADWAVDTSALEGNSMTRPWYQQPRKKKHHLHSYIHYQEMAHRYSRCGLQHLKAKLRAIKNFKLYISSLGNHLLSRRSLSTDQSDTKQSNLPQSPSPSSQQLLPSSDESPMVTPPKKSNSIPASIPIRGPPASSSDGSNNERWKIVCYARIQPSGTYTLPGILYSISPAIFIIAFIVALRGHAEDREERIVLE